MIIDYLVYGLMVFGVATLLNATLFKAKPASSSAAWGLTIAVFFINLVVLSTLRAFRYKAISESLGSQSQISLGRLLALYSFSFRIHLYFLTCENSPFNNFSISCTCGSLILQPK